MRIQGLVGTAGSVVLALASVSGVEAGIRTDRLSGKKLQAWSAIVAIVKATDEAGRPLYPRLRAVWDAVDASGCDVFVELPDPRSRRLYILGWFAVTKVDAGGTAVEGVLVMNLAAIDRAASGPGAARPNGFVPFAGLGKKGRYAEVLGHELTHAAWGFADPERTRLSMGLPGEVEALSRQILAAPAAQRSEAVTERARELERLSREVEAPAETAEQAIWAELAAGQEARWSAGPGGRRGRGPAGRGPPAATYFSRRAFFTSVAASQAGRMESRSRT
jgi:hypothetical protein